MTILALIPARGGSKGVPRKNLRMVGDRSLLVRAIDACLGVQQIERVFVSTDDDGIRHRDFAFLALAGLANSCFCLQFSLGLADPLQPAAAALESPADDRGDPS